MARVLRYLLAAALSPFRRVMAVALWRSGARRVVLGIEVVDLDGSDPERTFAAVALALRTLAGARDLYLRRLRRYLGGIAVAPGGHINYNPQLNACILGVAELNRHSPERLAAALVHEATHARLWERGFRYRPAERERVEQVCTAAELRVARELPDSANTVAAIEAALQEPWWTEEAIRTRREIELRRLGAPAWVLRLLRFGQ